MKLLPKQPEKRNRIVGIMIGLLVPLVLGLCFHDKAEKIPIASFIYDQMHQFEYKALDLKFRVRGPLPSDAISDDIVLLDYDDETEEWAPFPPDRNYYVEIIRALSEPESKTKATFFDIFFFDPFGRQLDDAMADVLKDKFTSLAAVIQNDSEITMAVKEKMFEAYEILSSRPNSEQLSKASELLDDITNMDEVAAAIEKYRDVAVFIESNIDLSQLAPDRDAVLSDAITDADNVFLAQIVNNREGTPYSPEDILFNKLVHDAFSKLMPMADRTQTDNRLEVDVNKTIRNMQPEDYDMVIKGSEANEINGRKPFPLSPKVKQAMASETVKLKEKVDLAEYLNRPFGFTVPDDAPVPLDEIEKYYRYLIEIKPLYPEIARNAAGLGYVKPEFQMYDGTIRTAAPVSQFRDKLYPHIDMMLVMRYFGVKNEDVVFYKHKIVINNCKRPGSDKPETITIPLFKRGTMIVNWAGTYYNPGHFHHRSFHLVYESAKKYNLLKKEEMIATLNSMIEDEEKVNALYSIMERETEIQGMDDKTRLDMDIYDMRNYRLQDLDRSKFSDAEWRILETKTMPEVQNLINRGLNELEQQTLADMTDEEKEKVRREMQFFKGKVSMTGLTAEGTHDLNPMPFHARYPLVGMHANMANTILQGLFIHTAPFLVFMSVMLVLGVTIGFVGGSAKHLPGALATIGTILGFGLVTQLLFNYAKMWMPFVPVLVALALVYLSIILYRYMTEGQEAIRMKKMFSTYVNPSVVDTLIQNPDMLQLGGERMDLSAIFAMATGSALETDNAEVLVDRLNEYFTVMTDQIFDYDGTLDKYEGKIIMAVYGAPVPFEDHPTKVCMSLVGMKKAQEQLQAKWAQEGIGEIKTIVGCNSGPMIAGNMGSASRFNYTVMGDSVNLAARILGASIQYGLDFVISEYTYDRAKNDIDARLVDSIVVVGKEEPVRIYQIVGVKGDPIPDDEKKFLDAYAAGFQLYTERKWDEAIASFEKALEIRPDDKPSSMLLERTKGYKENPPAEDWGGEFVLTAKGL